MQWCNSWCPTATKDIHKQIWQISGKSDHAILRKKIQVVHLRLHEPQHVKWIRTLTFALKDWTTMFAKFARRKLLLYKRNMEVWQYGSKFVQMKLAFKTARLQEECSLVRIMQKSHVWWNHHKHLTPTIKHIGGFGFGLLPRDCSILQNLSVHQKFLGSNLANSESLVKITFMQQDKDFKNSRESRRKWIRILY